MIETISADEFRDRIDARRRGDRSFTVVDTRPEESFEGWRVADAVHYFYRPFHEFGLADFERETGLSPDDSVVTLCAKGKASDDFAAELAAAGYEDVTVVADGMRGWSAVYDRTEVPLPDAPDSAPPPDVVQVPRRAKGRLGYPVVGGRCGFLTTRPAYGDTLRRLLTVKWVSSGLVSGGFLYRSGVQSVYSGVRRRSRRSPFGTARSCISVKNRVAVRQPINLDQSKSNMPTDAAEDYLRSIYRTESRAGPPVSTSQIAESLDEVPATVTSMVETFADRGTVVRVSDRDPDVLEFLVDAGVTPGTTVEVVDVTAFGLVTVRTDAGDKRDLPDAVASGVSVRRDTDSGSAVDGREAGDA